MEITYQLNLFEHGQISDKPIVAEKHQYPVITNKTAKTKSL